ncbi:MAG: L,D-transpeptidase [Acidobacteria bacterium]|nr:L,D-transpeptidase [Acidobacteriota bacterium]
MSKLVILSQCALLLFAAVALSSCQQQADGSAPVSAAPEGSRNETEAKPSPATRDELTTEQEAANRLPLKLPLVNPKIVVTKSARRLVLYSNGGAVRTYKVALGFNQKDDKVKQDDGATPEGNFYVCVRNENSRFYRSLGLSYPNTEDAARGLRDKLITRAQYERIVSAIEAKQRPPWDTPLGGEIFIHGGGSQNDWTSGCIALENEQMKELFDAVPKGTPVVVEP